MGQAFIAVMMGVDTPLAIMQMDATPFVLGAAYSAWALGRAGSGFLAGTVFDRRGAKGGLLLSFGLLAVVASGYSLLLGPWVMVFLRLLQGMSAGIYWTSILSLVGQRVSPTRRVQRLATFNIAVALGGIGGGVVGGWLVAGVGYRVPFWIAVLLALTLAVVTALVVHNAPNPVRTSPLPRRFVMTAGIGAISVFGGLSQLPSVLSNAALPLELLRYGRGASALGIENAALVFGNLVGQWGMYRYPQLAQRKTALIALYGIGILAVAGTAVASNSWLLMAALVLVGTMVNLYSIIWTAAIQRQSGAQDVGRATGLLRSTGDAMSAASYPLVGVAAHDPGETGLALTLVLAGGVVYIWQWLRPGSELEPSQEESYRA